VSGILKFYYLFYTFSWVFRVPKRKSQTSHGAPFPLLSSALSPEPAYVVYETFAFLSETPYLFLVFLRALPPNEPGIYFHVVDVIEKTRGKRRVCVIIGGDFI
jgi:hypothetical protein